MNGEETGSGGGEKCVREKRKTKIILLITHYGPPYVSSYYARPLVPIVQVPNLIYIYIYRVFVGLCNPILSPFNLYTVGIQILLDKLLSLSRLPSWHQRHLSFSLDSLSLSNT